MRTLGYLTLQKGFVPGWVLWKQMPTWSLKCKMLVRDPNPGREGSRNRQRKRLKRSQPT